MKYTFIIILLFGSLTVNAQATLSLGLSQQLYGERPVGHHLPATDTTIVLNKGNTACIHEFVEQKPMTHSNWSNAVYIDPEQDRFWEVFRICKLCLRHEQIKYHAEWVLDKDEYGELLKKIKP